MLSSQVSILTVNSSVAQISMAVSCTNCSGLVASDVTMMIYRKGVEYLCNSDVPAAQQYPNCQQPPNNANGPCPTPYSPNVGPNPIYFLTYTCFSLVGNIASFAIDDNLTGMCQGRFVGDVYVNGKQCGSVEMNVGDTCGVFMPQVLIPSPSLGNDLQPS